MNLDLDPMNFRVCEPLSVEASGQLDVLWSSLEIQSWN